MRKSKYGLLTLASALFPAIVWAKTVTPEEFWHIAQTQHPIIVDVRTADEFATGHLPDAINIPFDEIANIGNYLSDTSTPILLYCRSGRRAELAENTLYTLGYESTYNGLSYQLLLNTKTKSTSQ